MLTEVKSENDRPGDTRAFFRRMQWSNVALHALEKSSSVLFNSKSKKMLKYKNSAKLKFLNSNASFLDQSLKARDFQTNS